MHVHILQHAQASHAVCCAYVCTIVCMQVAQQSNSVGLKTNGYIEIKQQKQKHALFFSIHSLDARAFR